MFHHRALQATTLRACEDIAAQALPSPVQPGPPTEAFATAMATLLWPGPCCRRLQRERQGRRRVSAVYATCPLRLAPFPPHLQTLRLPSPRHPTPFNPSTPIDRSAILAPLVGAAVLQHIVLLLWDASAALLSAAVLLSAAELSAASNAADNAAVTNAGPPLSMLGALRACLLKHGASLRDAPVRVHINTRRGGKHCEVGASMVSLSVDAALQSSAWLSVSPLSPTSSSLCLLLASTVRISSSL